MDDWTDYCSVAAPLHGPEVDELERSAQHLIARLESFGKPVQQVLPTGQMPSDRQSADLPTSPASSEVSMAGARRSSLDGGTSQASDCSVTSASPTASRLYAHTRAKQQKSMVGKENEAHVPKINPRSKSLAGRRDGDIAARLHEAGREREARRIAAIAQAEQREALEAADKREAIPEINLVSAQLAGARVGPVADRLFEGAREIARKHEERSQEVEREASTLARPAVSEGSMRIAAMMQGRKGPVQERLYATAAEKAENAT